MSTPRDPVGGRPSQSEGTPLFLVLRADYAPLYTSATELSGATAPETNRDPQKPEKGQSNPNVTAELFLNEVSLVFRESPMGH